MKDNKQSIADLIGALAEDIEDVKKKLDAKDSSDKDEALKRLDGETGTCYTVLQWQCPGKCQ